ncbi:MAG: GYD domain-containing protein [Candidatus Binataceae bacterium]
MPTYIIGVKLVENRTDKEFAEAIERVAQVRAAHQGRLIASYVTFGRYDMVWISEYENERAAFDAMNIVGAQGMFKHEISEAIALEEFLRIKDS